MNRSVVIMIVTWTAAIGFGITVGWIANDLRDAKCPAEDSCTADYRDGGWHIEEKR